LLPTYCKLIKTRMLMHKKQPKLSTPINATIDCMFVPVYVLRNKWFFYFKSPHKRQPKRNDNNYFSKWS